MLWLGDVSLLSYNEKFNVCLLTKGKEAWVTEQKPSVNI